MLVHENQLPKFASAIVPKVWGTEYHLVNRAYCAKILAARPGFVSSFHKHTRKAETFILLQGCLRLRLEGSNMERVLNPGDQHTINPGTGHSFEAVGATAYILEVSTHHDDADVIRLSESGPVNNDQPVRVGTERHGKPACSR